MYGFGAAVDCNSFWSKWANLSSISACLCLENPWACSDDTHAAARLLTDPTMITSPGMPLVVGAPSGAALIVPPDDAAQAQSLIDELLSGQWEEWQGENRAVVASTNQNLQRPGADSAGVPWYWWALGGLGAFAVISLSAGSPRRYGR